MSSTNAADAGGTGIVLSLDAVGRGDLAVAGGKGANLGELVRGGFPVPPGFVVSTAAYDRFVGENGLAGVISRELASNQGSGAAIRNAFERGRIPPEVERDILAAYSSPCPWPGGRCRDASRGPGTD